MPESSPAVAPHLTGALADVIALTRRTQDPRILRTIATLLDELVAAPARRGFGVAEVDAALRVALQHFVRCVDDGAPSEIVAGRAAAISGALAVRGAHFR